MATGSTKLRIPPFDPRTKFIEGKPNEYGSGVSNSHTKWLKQVSDEINASPEIVQLPASLTAPGNPGQISITDPGFLWVCVAENTWKRIAWTP